MAGITQAGRSRDSPSDGGIVEGLRAGADGAATGAAVFAATTSSGATFGVQAGVETALQVCCAGAGDAGAGGFDGTPLGALAGGSYSGGGGAAGGTGAAGVAGAAVSQVGGAGPLVPNGVGGGRLVE
jgi:hypothetical protein